jgi:threonine dehydrogenase-like Zn-dependent dehydrogenase
MGADATINYSKENLRDALKALTDGKGPDVIYDPVGGDFAEPPSAPSPGAAATWWWALRPGRSRLCR